MIFDGAAKKYGFKSKPLTAPSQSPKNTTPNTIEVPIHQLYLDPNNYRFIDSKEYQKVAETDVTKDNIQIRTRRLIEEKGQEGIKDLLANLKANGFLPIDMIQVEKIGENQYKVVEGNRRVAAVKFLQEEYTTLSIDIEFVRRCVCAYS
jgi:hypothetical protein